MGYKRLNHYFYLSFVVSVLLWAFLFWENPDFFHKGLFTSFFLVGSFGIWSFMGPYKKFYQALPLLFLFQGVSLLGCSFEFRESYPFFLTLIPLLAGIYFLRGNSERVFLLSCFVISGFIFKLVFNYVPFTYKESLALFIILSWALGVFLVFSKFGKDQLRETYLFHDLLAHTHGLSLFLSQRFKKGLTSKETVRVSEEIESLQNIMGQHFNAGFKGKKKQIKISEIEDVVKSLCEQFLPKIEFEIKTNGIMGDEQIPFNEFFRSMGNILKNVADAKSDKCDILLENQDTGISIIIKNTFPHKTLKESSGIGLKSTQELLEEIGGIFCFYSQDKLWVSRLYIPYQVELKKVA